MPSALLKTGESLLEKGDGIDELDILAEGFENTGRKTQLLKVGQAYKIYKELIIYHGMQQLITWMEIKNITGFPALMHSLDIRSGRESWMNIGGQLIPAPAVKKLLRNINSGKIGSWDEVHAFYKIQSDRYQQDKTNHAFASLLEILKLPRERFNRKIFLQLLPEVLTTKKWMTTAIYESRAKDYSNPFRRMVYETEKEMEKVTGKLADNSFIRQQAEEMAAFEKKVSQLLRTLA